MSVIRSNFQARLQAANKQPLKASAKPVFKWPSLNDAEEHQEMNPENPNHFGHFPFSTCNGRITRHKIKKEGKNQGKFFFTCDCQGEDEAGKRKNGIMMEVEFKKNPNAMIRCKTIEALVKKEQIKDALNQQLGRAGLQKSHAHQDAWDCWADYSDSLCEEEQIFYLQKLEAWHDKYLAGGHKYQREEPEGEVKFEEGEITDD